MKFIPSAIVPIIREGVFLNCNLFDILKNKKYGIPFNAIYNSNNPQGIVLSELLSENEIVKTLNNL